MSDASAHSHTLPAVHVQHLIDLLARWHVTGDQLLAGLDVSPESLAIPGARVRVDTLSQVIGRALALSGEPALGFYFGMSMKVSWHGFLGFAAMCASTVREAIELACQYTPTRTSALVLRLEESGDTGALVIEERAPLGEAREPLIVALVVGVWQIGNTLVGSTIPGEAHFGFPEPGYFARFGQINPGHAHFDAVDHRMVFDRAILELPLTNADPGGLELARRQCDQELDAVRGEDDIVGQVRALIRDPASGVRTAEQAARAIAVSPRTLKRKLAGFGTSFTDLVTEERRRLASAMLRDGKSVDRIAERLGYADAQGFSRAYRRWTGMTPSAYRRLVTSK